AGLLPAARLRADELILQGGKRLPGTLELDGKGRLRFAPTGQAVPSSLTGLDIRLTPASLPTRLAATAHRVILPHDQHLTGELLHLNEKELTLRTAWSDRLSIPRSAVVAVTHLPGWVTFLDEDFEGDLKAWKLTGSPTRSDREQTSGKRSLLLDT